MTQLKLPRATSIKSYREIKREGKIGELQEIVLRHLRALGDSTAQEINHNVGLDGLWKRFSELRDLGLIEESGKRRCSVTGKTAIVWRVKEKRMEGKK